MVQGKTKTTQAQALDNDIIVMGVCYVQLQMGRMLYGAYDTCTTVTTWWPISHTSLKILKSSFVLKIAGQLIPLHWTLVSQTLKSISNSLKGSLYQDSITSHAITKLLAFKEVLIKKVVTYCALFWRHFLTLTFVLRHTVEAYRSCAVDPCKMN